MPQTSTRAKPRPRRRPKRKTTKKKGGKPKPTVKKNAAAIRKLFKMSDPKFKYAHLDNVLVNDSTQFTQLELTDIPASVLPSVDPLQYKYREADSSQVRIRNIRIHFTVHATPRDSGKSQKVWVALVKTSNLIGDTAPPATGIELPPVGAIWDLSGDAAGPLNQLAPWELYRITQGPGSEALKSTKILKTWQAYIAPQGGDCAQNFDTVTAVPPGTDISSTGASPALTNVNYTQDRKSQHYFTYTHKCLNALVKYESATSTDATNVKYFLVALAEDSDPASGYRLNASCKINYYDN